MKIPFKCPVCEGRGIVPPHFYDGYYGTFVSTNTACDSCRSCTGSGIIFSENEIELSEFLKIEDEKATAKIT